MRILRLTVYALALHRAGKERTMAKAEHHNISRRRRLREAGYRELTVVVPEAMASKVKRFCAMLRLGISVRCVSSGDKIEF
jgi:hypothetical protein